MPDHSRLPLIFSMAVFVALFPSPSFAQVSGPDTQSVPEIHSSKAEQTEDLHHQQRELERDVQQSKTRIKMLNAEELALRKRLEELDREKLEVEARISRLMESLRALTARIESMNDEAFKDQNELPTFQPQFPIEIERAMFMDSQPMFRLQR
ncbi:hypothetical protein Pla22_09580 [Rubripirellula amarantea]|uniref:Uncharacterized protein n=1 Tax=Rubripirellula amarantea TaxID=2527999 RepID=A0A5C5WT37_9BACT|nr:hypothetical protein [Rubripirellula amarantea]TWT53329.1 hypothetical protein Pla22_09580 [Rubripirellula amarantea]